MKDWLFYRIYAKPVEGWYHNLLREIVNPFFSDCEKLIGSFFFFHYHCLYGVKPLDNIEAYKPKFRRGEEVRFIKLRVLAEQKDLDTLKESLDRIIKQSQIVLTYEECPYNEKADLGKRFGEARRELVRKYLEYASRITLSLLEERQYQ